MFTKHQPLIAAHAKTPQGFIDVITFVIATQNRYFYRVGKIIDSIHTEGFDNVKHFTREQKNGIVYAAQHADYFINRLHAAIPDNYKIRCLIEIPHIGIVKAGFILQLCCGTVGCLDRHNLQMLGLDIKAFNRVPTNTTALASRIETYITTCQRLGSCEDLYNGWCRFIATKYPQHFVTADTVSYLHAKWSRAI